MTTADGSSDDSLDAIDAAILADDLSASEDQRRFDFMPDGQLDGVAYADDALLDDPMGCTPRPGFSEGFCAEQRAEAIHAGERLPGLLEELRAESALDPRGVAAVDLELQRVEMNARDFPPGATEVRESRKHAETGGPRHRAPTSRRDWNYDLDR